MFDYTHLKPNDLSRIGIVFATQDEFSRFSDYALDTLQLRIGGKISKGIPEELLLEFDLIEDEQESIQWLNKNRPDYREIADREQHLLTWELLRLRDELSTTPVRPLPHGIDDELSRIGLSAEALSSLNDQGLQRVRDVLAVRDLSALEGMEGDKWFEVACAIVDHILADE